MIQLSRAYSLPKKSATRSVYMFLTNGGISSRTGKEIGKCKVPMKIRIFL
jgi:hypothetical protein